MNFEDNIRKLLEQEYKKRIELNNGKYTELQFAKDLGLGKDSMHTYLTGKRVPNADSLVRIANGLNVSVDYLLGLSNKKSIEPTEDEKAFARVSELTGLSVEALSILYRIHGEMGIFINNVKPIKIPPLRKKSFETLSSLICSTDFFDLLDSFREYFDFDKEKVQQNGSIYYLFSDSEALIKENKYRFEISDINIVEGLLLNNISKILERIKYNYSKNTSIDIRNIDDYFSKFNEYVDTAYNTLEFMGASYDNELDRKMRDTFDTLLEQSDK